MIGRYGSSDMCIDGCKNQVVDRIRGLCKEHLAKLMDEWKREQTALDAAQNGEMVKE